MPEADLAALESIPNVAGVYVVWPREGIPHLGRTTVLRRRVQRLARIFGPETIARLEYHPAGSPFESMVLLYRLARRHRPGDYRKFLRLRLPPFLKVNLANAYPRCYITRRLGREQSLYFGPFTTRAAAERFQNAFLDLFLMRRCREEIAPDPAHPGCIYGEMNMCLRPCQAAASQEHYGTEAGRVVQFLSTRGESLMKQFEGERDQASAGLEFEQAARIHKRMEKAREALAQNEDLARDLDRLHGVMVQRSVAPDAVELWCLHQGYLQSPRRLSLAVEEGRPVSLDQKLREMLAGVRSKRRSPRDRAEQLALLVRWQASSWKQGELLLFEDWAQAPYRKLVRAISRVA